MSLEIAEIYCNHLIEPLGITDEIVFSFLPKEGSEDFSACCVVCGTLSNFLETKKFDVWNKKIVTENCFGIKYDGRILPDGQRFYFAIGLYDKKGNFGGFCSPSFFETGLSHESFTAKWVYDKDFTGACPLFLQGFELKKRVSTARLYVTGLGYFDCLLNNQKLDECYFKPVVTIYDDRPLNGILPYYFNNPVKRIYYHTYDIQSLLTEKNLLSVMVGCGWYYNVEKEMEGNYSYGTPRAMFEIHIEYVDGSREIVASGEKTKVVSSYIRASTHFKGEVQDFNYPQENFFCANDLLFSTVKSTLLRCADIALKAPTGRLQGNIFPNDRIITHLSPRESHFANGRQVVDFGQNHAGVLCVEARGEKGARLTIHMSEELDENGALDHLSTGWNFLIETDVCIFNGETVKFSPRFTFHGYRYADFEIEGNIEIFKIESLVVSANIAHCGSFSCSEPIINDIASLYLHTQTSNLHGCIPSDCPHREKRGFTGDGQVTCAAAMCAFDMTSFYRKWMQDILDCQDSETGSVSHTAPYSGGGCSPGFGAAIAILPDEYFRYYGDDSLLFESIGGILHWIDYLNHQHNGDYIITREEREWSLGEWFCPDRIDVPREFIKTYFFAKCCIIALCAIRHFQEKKENKLDDEKSKAFNARYQSQINEETENELKQLLQNICQSMKQTFLEKDGNFCQNLNGANLFALDIDLLFGEEKEKLIQNTLDFYHQNPKINTGIFGTRLLFEFLTDYHADDLAFAFLTSCEHPSYGFMLKNGATTLWECWEKSYTPDFYYQKDSMMKGYPASHNHPMLGSIYAWLHKNVGGLDFSMFAEKHLVIIHPKLFKQIPACTVSQKTPFGNIALSYQFQNKKFTKFDVEIPTNVYAKVILGEREIELLSGNYHLGEE